MTSTTDNRTLTLTFEVTTYYSAEMDYDDFKEKVMRQFKKETEEEFEARCKKHWEQLLEEHGEEIDLGSSDIDYCGYDELQEIVEMNDLEEEWDLNEHCALCKRRIDYESSNDGKLCRQCYKNEI